MRQAPCRPKTRTLVRTFGVTFLSPQTLEYPVEQWDSLVYAVRGVVTVETPRGAWVLPAQRALWVPIGTRYRLQIPGPVSLRSLYLQAGFCRNMPRECAAVNVTPLLRELILAAVRIGALDNQIAEQGRLAGVIVDQLRAAHGVPLQLPMPSADSASRAANLMMADPGARRSRAEIAKVAGAGLRTLERQFREQTGMTLGAWRRRLRILNALRSLASGVSVTEVALATGYHSVSAFVSMFRRETQVTPSRYFRPKA